MDRIIFKKASFNEKDIIFSWLEEPHVKEFWDSSDAHKKDILNFMAGRLEPSSYCDGKFVYWIAFQGKDPFAFLMTIQTTAQDPIDAIKVDYISKTGHTYGIDYMIGNPAYVGKGYGALTLTRFIDFFRSNVDPKADTFLIDPEASNPRAKHVYEKAGFQHVGDFTMEEMGASGNGKKHHLLVKKF